jgi:chemotaxis protein CheD
MGSRENRPEIRNHLLEPGFIYVPRQPTCISAVLGSCVSVCLHDRKKRVGGMNHFRYPFIDDRTRATAVYGNVATIALIRMMIRNGSREKHLEAQILGGAFSPEMFATDVGRKNVAVARRTLERFRVRIVSEDVGGQRGRKFVFNTETAELAVMRVERLRKMDWYPYANDR